MRTVIIAGAVGALVLTQSAPARADAGAIGLGVGLGIAVIGAILNDAARQRQQTAPPPAYAGNSAACQSWLAVLNDPRYDAATRAQAQQIVSSCGITVPVPSSPATTYAPSAASNSSEIPLQRRGGVFVVATLLNGVMTYPFVLDTGASDVQIPLSLAKILVDNGTLTEGDLRGSATYTNAAGGREQNERFLLHELRIGDRVIHNVLASVGPVPLLGQTALSQLGRYTVDSGRALLIFN